MKRSIIASILISIITPPVMAETPLIPRSVLFGEPERTDVQLSPDGRRVSYLAPVDGVRNIWIETVDDLAGATEAQPVTRSSTYPIREYTWAVNGTQILYLHDPTGDRDTHLYALDIDSGAVRDLTPLPGVRARIVSTHRDRPDTVVVAIDDRVPGLEDLWSVDTRTGARSLILENHRSYDRMFVDNTLIARVASRPSPGGGRRVFTRDHAADGWYELVYWNLADAASSRVLSLSHDDRIIYVQEARESDLSRLCAYTSQRGDGPYYDILAEEDDAEIADVIFDPRSGRPQAVAFERARRTWRFLDGAFEADWQRTVGIDAGEPTLVGRDADDRRWLLAFEPDDGPRRYHLVDRDGLRTRFLFADHPALATAGLSTMEPVTIRARDGLELISYLTLPDGATRDEARLHPTVLLVHDGPWSRQSWGFDPVHQWLANRGYAVLSVNFRGSAGFGKQFMAAGNRQWSGRMHDDLIDAVNWAVEVGVADPDRVAIMGRGYGGYAALVGLTMTAPFFAAGVDLMGPAHVRTMLESIPESQTATRSIYETRVGKLDQQEFLELISPLNYADAIRRPLLVGHGRYDPRVRGQEHRQIIDAMERRNLPVTYVVFPDEGTTLERRENAIAFHAIVEAFLAQHLGGRREPLGSDVRSSSADVQVGAPLIPGLAEVFEAPAGVR